MFVGVFVEVGAVGQGTAQQGDIFEAQAQVSRMRFPVYINLAFWLIGSKKALT